MKIMAQHWTGEMTYFSTKYSQYLLKVMGKMRPKNKGKYKKNGYFAKSLKAQKPFRFAFGSLFIAKKFTKRTFMRSVFDRILECLLLDQ